MPPDSSRPQTGPTSASSMPSVEEGEVRAYNDYLRAYQERAQAAIDQMMRAGNDPARARSSRSSSGNFSNYSFDRPDISPEMQPLVDELLRQYSSDFQRGAETGSYLPAGYERSALRNIGNAGAIQENRFNEAAGGMPGGFNSGSDPANPFRRSVTADSLNLSQSIPELEDQARDTLRAGYEGTVDAFGRTSEKSERGTYDNSSTTDAPRDPTELLSFLSPRGPQGVYTGPTSNAFGNAADIARTFGNLAPAFAGSGGNNNPTGTVTCPPGTTPVGGSCV